MQRYKRYTLTHYSNASKPSVRRTIPNRQAQTGSTLLWVILWLAGMAAISYWCVTRHVPALQLKIQTSAQAALDVAGTGANNVSLDVQGRTANLSGLVASESVRKKLVESVANADGIRNVNDQLTITGQGVASTEDNVIIANNAANNAADKAAINAADNVADANNVDDSDSSTDPTQNPTDTQNDSDVQSDNELSSETDAASEPLAVNEETENQNNNVAASDVAPSDVESNDVEPAIQETNENANATTSGSEENDGLDSPDISEADAGENEEVLDSVEQRARELIERARAKRRDQAASDQAASDQAAGDQPAQNNVRSNDPETDVISPPASVAAIPATATPEDSDALGAEASTQPGNNASSSDEASLPSFNVLTNEGTLNLTGDISNRDNLLRFIQSAMNTFNANYVVNSVQVHDNRSSASWLPSLTRFIPSMQNIKDAKIEITEKQITLSGFANNEQEHDEVINDALSILTELSLVERISVSEQGENQVKPAQGSQTETDALVESQPADRQAVATQTVDVDVQRSLLRQSFDALEREKILFQSGSDILTDESLRSVEQIGELLAQYPDVDIEIDGHTDSSGTKANNLQLSQLRANAVRDYLIQQGIASSRLTAYGFGDGVPIADNGTAAGRQLNRRIEFNF